MDPWQGKVPSLSLSGGPRAGGGAPAQVDEATSVRAIEDGRTTNDPRSGAVHENRPLDLAQRCRSGRKRPGEGYGTADVRCSALG